MFWKGFSQTRSAGKLFNEANKHWAKAGGSLKLKDEGNLRSELVEVIRLCQLSIQTDKQNGDSYVLLADALLLAALSSPRDSDPERYGFLLTRAAAVIHLWYSLPHRGYPITKNTKRAEQLWRTILDTVKEENALSEDAAVVLMDSYRNDLAQETISPTSFADIKNAILTGFARESQRDLSQQLEETLPPPIMAFLTKVLKVLFETETLELHGKDNRLARTDKMLEELKEMPLANEVHIEILERVRRASNGNDCRQAIGWVTWLSLLNAYQRGSVLQNIPSLDRPSGGELEVVGLILKQARVANDVDSLLLAIGFCHLVGSQKLCDDLLQQVRAQIGEHALLDRVRGIEQQPRMVVESLLIGQLRDYLRKA